MLSGMNFGCGSSREHAPQSLHRAGYRAVIAGNFAEIFFGNAINLGIPCVTLQQSERNSLAEIIESTPSTEIKIDLVNREIVVNEIRFTFEIRDGARESLINGKWDPIDELLSKGEDIQKVASSLSYR
jgi:3-isopropylmalate/(R)-2-methylmalate dehydratase small subunit